MKTLEELVKELGLKPSRYEKVKGRQGNFVCISNKRYTTVDSLSKARLFDAKVIEVKPE